MGRTEQKAFYVRGVGNVQAIIDQGWRVTSIAGICTNGNYEYWMVIGERIVEAQPTRGDGEP